MGEVLKEALGRPRHLKVSTEAISYLRQGGLFDTLGPQSGTIITLNYMQGFLLLGIDLRVENCPGALRTTGAPIDSHKKGI